MIPKMICPQRQHVNSTFQIFEDEMDTIDSSIEESLREHNVDEDVEQNYDSTDSEGSIDPVVRDDMEKFQKTFHGITERFRLINRIGEGTFSTVYKAEDLLYDRYENSWDLPETDDTQWASPPNKKRRLEAEASDKRRAPKFVAIKKIYVTSSPSRILNELELLADLRNCESVCPLITAFRHTDQVVAVLPYFPHTDFRNYFRDMTIPDIRIYFRSLFTALATVHEKDIIHRDIKPTNFLYEPGRRRGVLVDFGLAEREGTDSRPCLCTESQTERRRRISHSVTATIGPPIGYLKNDPRPSRRANRAGTRGFRAPEVLLKCTDQTTKIDIWSAGVILLTILSRRFPFFNSADDVEAMIEIATIFGTKRMKHCALLHGAIFQTNIPTIGSHGFSLEKIILWSTCRNQLVGGRLEDPLSKDELLAVSFLEKCLALDPQKRFSAEDALEHEFLDVSSIDSRPN
ncbi:Cell cycle serine/threonine-protein kinase hsk1 [Golovinomyces cichoracearum]|uniref:non-specific serine/threonine protein kinase n=1 Tax=Golovinomyces cichoracearum TaxID=62708 RepID=A0A420IEY2_9PEZI|nr:Cell cycle serine/threonine-protein kinase hsk1 [Golovinomyces cichoracearum]